MEFCLRVAEKDYENLDGIAGNSAEIRSVYHINLILEC
jgi:hypothetical protein